LTDQHGKLNPLNGRDSKRGVAGLLLLSLALVVATVILLVQLMLRDPLSNIVTYATATFVAIAMVAYATIALRANARLRALRQEVKRFMTRVGRRP
jgi:hypothetical protein